MVWLKDNYERNARTRVQALKQLYHVSALTTHTHTAHGSIVNLKDLIRDMLTAISIILVKNQDVRNDCCSFPPVLASTGIFKRFKRPNLAPKAFSLFFFFFSPS